MVETRQRDLVKFDLGQWLSDVEGHKALAVCTPHEGGYEGRYLNQLRYQGYHFLDLTARGLGVPETTLTKVHPVCPAHVETGIVKGRTAVSCIAPNIPAKGQAYCGMRKLEKGSVEATPRDCRFTRKLMKEHDLTARQPKHSEKYSSIIISNTVMG